MSEIKITVELHPGHDSGNFEMAMLLALKTNPAIKRVHVDVDEDEQEWSEEELEQLIQLPNGQEISIEETRHLYLRINELIHVRIPRQELTILEFLSAQPLLIRGQDEFHRKLSNYKSTLFDGQQVFKHSTPKLVTSLYSRLRKRIEGLPLIDDLTGRRGWYGFRTALMPQGKNVSRIRRPDPLLDPRIPLDQALARAM